MYFSALLYTVAEAAEISGLSKGMINYLQRAEFITPAQRPVSRRGLKRAFAYRDLLLMMTIADLLDRGTEIARLKKDLRRLRNSIYFRDDELCFYELKQQVGEIVAVGGGKIISISAPGQYVLPLSVNVVGMHEKALAGAASVVESRTNRR